MIMAIDSITYMAATNMATKDIRFFPFFSAALLLTISIDVNALSLSFGVYTADSPTVVVKQFRPTLNVIEAQLGDLIGEPVAIKMQIARTYEQGVEDLVEGRVDFARLGPASYVVAKKANAEISILAMESRKGKKRFKGVICVPEDSSITTVNDLRGKRFAFGNERSTIGRYLAQQDLVQGGIYADDLSSHVYLQRHDEVGLAVAAGQYDAGALKESTFNRLVDQGSRLRVLVSFDNVTKPWVGNHLLDSNLKEHLIKVLLSLNNGTTSNTSIKDGFLPGTDDDYQMVRSAIENSSKFSD